VASYKVIFFDFGGTIATMKPPKESILRNFLASKAIDVPIEQITQAYRIVDYCHKQSALELKNKNDKKSFLIKFNSEVLKVLGLAKKSALWGQELFDFFQTKKRWDLFPDVFEVLESLKEQGFSMTILANWDKSLKMIVRKLGIRQYFMEILSSEEIKMEKPDPEVFLYALRLISVSPEESIYVGNEYETDVIGSRSAGLVPVLIDRDRFWPYADCLRFQNLLGLDEYLKD